MALNTTGTVTRVGVDNIQFYIRKEVSADRRCPFDPEDDFEAQLVPYAGLVLTPPERTVTLKDVLEALDVPTDHDHSLHERQL